jgi:hypothetical protein
MMAGFALALAAAASVLTTFSGLITDPVQRLLGLHQRRLRRLIDRLETAATGVERPFGTGEHLLARLGDAADLVVSLLRQLRP